MIVYHGTMTQITMSILVTMDGPRLLTNKQGVTHP